MDEAQRRRLAEMMVYGSLDGGGSFGGGPYGHQGGVGVSGMLGLNYGDYYGQASGDVAASMFLPNAETRQWGVGNDYTISDPALRELKFGKQNTVFGGDDLSLSLQPNENMNGLNGGMLRYKSRF
jgi:hypothetical protein